ncbi:ABC transporter ATP-binding protein [Metabacillus malikii]|uniref:ABC transport system ATP-binding protein n=1 Tax=Metabacillus malikii TaxID=1504265 RepID=A0ABT9ZHB4_9BACI|nr:ABC transporter ATP-binding protein [Metabacillus malikii]MDQ0231662.1 putative ABC transport system ATP-binding protein [Metabacillus malikii]
MIQLKEVFKTYTGRNYKVNALNGIDITIPNAQYVSLVGKSGSGKSSLIKIIGLLDFDYRGEYIFQEKRLEQHFNDQIISNYRKRIGYVFQDFQLIDRYTVQKNIEIASVIKLGKLDTVAVENSLRKVGMLEKKDSYPDELSGGQKQRVAIARAMVSNPEIIIADEPTGAVDEANTKGILKLLEEIHDTFNTTIIIVTHDKDVALSAQRIIELRDGRVKSDIFC